MAIYIKVIINTLAKKCCSIIYIMSNYWEIQLVSVQSTLTPTPLSDSEHIGFPPNSTFYCPALLYTLDIVINRYGYWCFFCPWWEFVHLRWSFVFLGKMGFGYLFFFFVFFIFVIGFIF